MRIVPLFALLLAAAGCRENRAAQTAPTRPPPAPSPVLMPLIGDYAAGSDTLSVLEDSGTLQVQRWHAAEQPLAPVTDSTFHVGGALLTFHRQPHAAVSGLTLGSDDFERLHFGPEDGSQFRIVPLRPVDELRREALAAAPPDEKGDFLPSDLVELVKLDSTIHLDIRYATTNNFMGEAFYAEPRAFLQRPAAEAVVRASRWLRDRGYGLLVHDGYRPWYVTKMFWDATPDSLKVFVANPAEGSRHNRGCAVDLTLYDLATGKPVVMTGGYDEMSPRSYPDYPGGTSRQRWFRSLLRQAMEAQGFTVYQAEWWHFDYKDWKRYRIGNERFEQIEAG